MMRVYTGSRAEGRWILSTNSVDVLLPHPYVWSVVGTGLYWSWWNEIRIYDGDMQMAQ